VVFNLKRNYYEFVKYLKENRLDTPRLFSEIEESKNFIFLGTDIVETHPVLYLRMRGLVTLKGARLFWDS